MEAYRVEDMSDKSRVSQSRGFPAYSCITPARKYPWALSACWSFVRAAEPVPDHLVLPPRGIGLDCHHAFCTDDGCHRVFVATGFCSIQSLFLYPMMRIVPSWMKVNCPMGLLVGDGEICVVGRHPFGGGCDSPCDRGFSLAAGIFFTEDSLCPLQFKFGT